MKKSTFSILLFICLGAFGLQAQKSSATSNDKEALILHGVQQFIKQVHFEPKPIDDKFSEAVFDIYIDRLDRAKRYFTAADIAKLEKYKLEIDDQVNVKTFEFFDLSLELLEKRYAQTKEFYAELIDAEYDFTKQEELERDYDKKSFAADDMALKDEWRKMIKFDIMNRVADYQEKQSKEDYDGEVLTHEQMVEKGRAKIKENYKDWFERLDKLRRSDRFETYIGSITNYFDPHTDFFNPKEKQDFDINMGGKLEGIGARLQQSGDYIKVSSIIPGGPAWKGKELEVDDEIRAVTQFGGETLDITGMRMDDVIGHIRGKKGTKVILTVKKLGGDMQDITIEREVVNIEESFAKSVILDAPNTVGNIGYIKLPKFYSSFEKEDGNSCAKDVAKEIEKLKENNVRGIILDLRDNTGGSLNDVVEMSGLFIEEGPIVQVKSRTSKPYVHKDSDDGVLYDGPLIVMVNNMSASASEILAAAMQDYGRAIIVGGTTFGKGSVQRFYDLDRALRGYDELKPLGNVKMTMQKFYRVNGGSTQLKGVVPDIIYPDNYKYVDYGEREYDYALEWTEIPPREYAQGVISFSHKGEIINNSQTRMKANERFALAEENAQRLKKMQDDTKVPLNLEQYVAKLDEKDEEAKKYKDLYKKEVEDLTIKNLPQDLESLKLDESIMARNEDWIDRLKKDFYLEETLKVMRDIIVLEKGFAQTSNKVIRP